MVINTMFTILLILTLELRCSLQKKGQQKKWVFIFNYGAKAPLHTCPEVALKQLLSPALHLPFYCVIVFTQGLFVTIENDQATFCLKKANHQNSIL